jgi:hypothetical protein
VKERFRPKLTGLAEMNGWFGTEAERVCLIIQVSSRVREAPLIRVAVLLIGGR